MKKKSTLIILLCSVAFALTGQSTHVLKGSVSNENGEPMPFVNIFLITSKTGTITNQDGAFSLIFSGNAEKLEISFIGYETQTMEINKDTKPLKIRLKPSLIQLNEFAMNALSAEELLKKAIEKIPENYPVNPILVKAYIRHKVSADDTLRYLQEMAYNIVKSYRPSFSDEIFLAKNRNFRFSTDHHNLIGVGDVDIVKDASKIFSSRFFRRTQIRYLSSTTFDNRSVYVMGISLKDEVDKIFGKIFIDERDLAFVRFELGKKGTHKIVAQYKKNGDKYYLMFGNSTTINKRNGQIIPVESDFLTTEIIHTFSRKDISGTPVDKYDILEVYASQKNDTIFWQQHNKILPDSAISEILKRYDIRQGRKFMKESSLQYQAYIKKLYTPNISLAVSSDLASDFSTFNHTLHSLNRFIPHLLDQSLRKPIPKLLNLVTYSYLLSPYFGEVASEWWFLNKNGMQTKMNPTIFNRYESAYLYGIDNNILSNFKNNNYLDFMRFHTVRNEGNLTRMFLIEEDLAKIDLSNKNNKSDYMMLYWMEFLWYRIVVNVTNLSKKDVKQPNKPENKQPLIVDRRRSWANYLFNPDATFQRHIQEEDLSEEMQKYVRRSGYWSLLNLISPQMFAISKFSLGEKHRFTFNTYYLPTPFGEMFGQNIWLMSNYRQLHGVFVRQYKNYEQTTLGAGYKLYDVKLFRNTYVTSSVDFWQQPTDFGFRETSSSFGFYVGQTFEYRLLRSRFSEQSKLSLILGYDYKTKGYMPESFFMGEHLNVKVGVQWFF